MGYPKVCVLLSTYNGEKYLKEQIDSILNQSSVEVELFVRDDGSKDETINILEDYCSRFSNVSYYKGDNIGVGKSYLELLRKAPSADFYSFADQDDYWLEDKLFRAVNVIMKAGNASMTVDGNFAFSGQKAGDYQKSGYQSSMPVLYGSNQTLVDEKLQEIGMHYKSVPNCDLLNCLSRNCFYGCSMVMNRQLRDIAVKYPDPDEKVLSRKNHDAWILYCALINGAVIYDHSSRILYRQHSNNVVGGRTLTGFALIRDKCKRITSGKNKKLRSTLADNLLTCYGSVLDPNNKKNLQDLANANSLKGIAKLIRNQELVNSFHEKKVIIFFRGLFRWI